MAKQAKNKAKTSKATDTPIATVEPAVVAVPPPAPDDTTKLEILKRLKGGREQRDVVGPLVTFLVSAGWRLDQMKFGRGEWRVPKSPSEATKRERSQSFDGFPCDVAIFDSPKRIGDPSHLLIVLETKIPEEEKGVAQLEVYMTCEPHVKLGVWVNNADPSAPAVFVFRTHDGRLIRRRRPLQDVPRPGETISAKQKRLLFNDMTVPSAQSLRRAIEDLLDRVVIDDSVVTRREDQLDQLCNMLLLKLESDKRAKMRPGDPPFFRPLESVARTAEDIKHEFGRFVRVYPDTFSTKQDQELRLADQTIYNCVEALAPYRLIDVGVSTIALAFQVLRAAASARARGSTSLRSR